MTAEVNDLIEEVLTTHYDTLTRKPKRGAYGEYVTQSKEKHLPTLSQRTFYARAKHHKSVYEQLLAREGARAAYPFKEYHHGAEKTIHRHGSYAWSMAHIDHLEVDLRALRFQNKPTPGQMLAHAHDPFVSPAYRCVLLDL